MPLPEMNLDERRFEDLYDEARRRIPGYTPEWTDHSESDPGIALTQLFAAFTEMLTWRLNRVPEKNYVKFLELIGIQLKPPTPARADLSFALSAPNPPPDGFVPIPKGTQVALSDAGEGGPVIFETDDNLYAVGTKLKALQTFDGGRFEVVTEANRVEGKSYFPFGKIPQKNSALYLGFDAPFPPGNGAKTVSLTVYAYTEGLIEEGKGLSAGPAPQAIKDEDVLERHQSSPTESLTPPVNAVWEFLGGSAKAPKWQELTIAEDSTSYFRRTGRVTFNPPAKDQMIKLRYGLLRKPNDEELFWLRYRIKEELGSGYEAAPRIQDVTLNTISATNAETVKEELLGASKGTPNQTFRLAKSPVLPDEFELQVDEGDGFKPWKAVRDFAGSTRTDQHFTLDLATGLVGFGDGERGKIPKRYVKPTEPDREFTNIKAASYRWGGGARGNAGARTITSLQSPVPFIESVTNPRPAVGGEDEEPLAQAKIRAPEIIRSRSRAVTAEDFESLARQTPGARIRRARALPLHHPDIEPMRPAGTPGATTIPVPGVVTVLVVPDALGETRKPIPSEETLLLVGAWLNQHRIITTELYVAAPRYRRVKIEAVVKVQPQADSGLVEKALREMLLAYFHPLTGGSGSGWDFGGTIYFAETFRRILDTPGVALVESGSVKTYVDDDRGRTCEDIVLAEDELVYSEEHTLNVTYV
jgi:predicted phage baseplate assembly protein